MDRGSWKLSNPICGSSKVFVLPFVKLGESLHLLPKVIGVREELTFVVPSLCGFLNNVDVSKPLWRAEPQDKSLSRVYSLLHSCLFSFMLALD
jgi:hypothetical protein